jgi:CDP-diacylglycerol pyrophosphatase
MREQRLAKKRYHLDRNDEAVMKKWSVVAAIASVVLLSASYRHFTKDADALWNVVHDSCTKQQQDHGKPRPCTVVNLPAGWAVLKDQEGETEFLLIPTNRVTGIDGPQILADHTHNYW